MNDILGLMEGQSSGTLLSSIYQEACKGKKKKKVEEDKSEMRESASGDYVEIKKIVEKHIGDAIAQEFVNRKLSPQIASIALSSKALQTQVVNSVFGFIRSKIL